MPPENEYQGCIDILIMASILLIIVLVIVMYLVYTPCAGCSVLPGFRGL